MSVSLDVNVLVVASQPENVHGAAARDLLLQLTAGPELLCLTWPVLSGYIRVITNTAIFPEALSTAEAVTNVRALLDRPRTRLLTEQEGFFDIYGALLRDHRARGNLVPDVHLAALLRQHGVRTLYTNDRDFRRFDFLEVRDPFEMDG